MIPFLLIAILYLYARPHSDQNTIRVIIINFRPLKIIKIVFYEHKLTLYCNITCDVSSCTNVPMLILTMETNQTE